MTGDQIYFLSEVKLSAKPLFFRGKRSAILPLFVALRNNLPNLPSILEVTCKQRINLSIFLGLLCEDVNNGHVTPVIQGLQVNAKATIVLHEDFIHMLVMRGWINHFNIVPDLHYGVVN